LCDAISGLFAAQAVGAFTGSLKERLGESRSYITAGDVFEIPEGEQFFAVDGA
jgi:hypothetical protein